MGIEREEDSRLSSVSSSLSSRRVSSEMSLHLTSLEVYYGGAPVAVPFKWESQPGTPKVRFRENALPPLTPPPSYLFRIPRTPDKKMSKSKGSGIFHAVIPRFLTSTKKNHNSSTVSSASSESSSLFSTSTYSGSSSSLYTRTPDNRNQNRRKPFEDEDEDEDYGYGSPFSSLCFRVRRSATLKPTRPRSK